MADGKGRIRDDRACQVCGDRESDVDFETCPLCCDSWCVFCFGDHDQEKCAKRYPS